MFHNAQNCLWRCDCSLLWPGAATVARWIAWWCWLPLHLCPGNQFKSYAENVSYLFVRFYLKQVWDNKDLYLQVQTLPANFQIIFKVPTRTANCYHGTLGCGGCTWDILPSGQRSKRFTSRWEPCHCFWMHHLVWETENKRLVKKQ